jgi:hypothetical protein
MSSLSFGYSGGAGTETDPYLISTTIDWQTLTDSSTDWNKNFILTENLDFNGLSIMPIGDTSTGFSGTFEGQGFIISNFVINLPESDSVGLFSGVSGQIRNLFVENVNITGHDYVGGLVGRNQYGMIINSYSTGSVNGHSAVGGLIGANYYAGIIIACYSTCSVTGEIDIGGLIGVNASMLTSSYSTGLVTGTSYVGGLVGFINSETSAINSCFWDVQTSGKANAVGYGGATGITGKSTAEMKMLSTFTNAGWDFTDENANGLHDYWQIQTDEYPRLTLHPWTLLGEGTPVNPYVIADAFDLAQIWLKPSACYILKNNLNLSGISWSTPVVPTFEGIFYGQGFIISNLTINQPNSNFVGLFGCLQKDGQIQNIGVENVNIIAHDYVGGLVGYSFSGKIDTCYSTGAVRGTNYVGGLMGFHYYQKITNCYSTCSVRGTARVGGLMGEEFLPGELINCYSAGLVSGGTYAGGLVGYVYGLGTLRANNCFWDTQSSGKTNAVGYGSWIGIKGLTTAAMKTMTSFTSVGWDFSGESANGLHDYWRMQANDYPRLTVHQWTLFGEGSSNNPYLISTPDDLGKIWLKPYAHYCLGSNLDLSGISWSTPIVQLFTGALDGRGFVISNLRINLSDMNYVSFFNKVGSAGQIQNLNMRNTYIAGYYCVSGLVGTNYGILRNCGSSGSVTGCHHAGGLVGENYGLITACYSAGSVQINSQYAYIGGLTGWNETPGSLVNCYSTSSVSGTGVQTSYVGGLVGTNSSTISNCYSTGLVAGNKGVGGLIGYLVTSGSATNCFWNTQTSLTIAGVQYGSSNGIVGKTTAEMKTLSTFTSVGWDFTNETTNGTANYWRMCVDRVDYPRLNWESVDGDFACLDGVNVEDLDYFVGQWLLTSCTADNNYCGGVDMDTSGAVDMSDLMIFAQHWLEGA